MALVNRDMWQTCGCALMTFVESSITADYKISFYYDDNMVAFVFQTSELAESFKILLALKEFKYEG